ncbi:MAG: hypothetical protein Q9M31_01525 [Mariprofundus sp.]|nr:hypothetical protein [Mariprofundus sp.]
MSARIHVIAVLGLVMFLLAACGNREKVDVMFECASPSAQKIATFYRVSTGDRAIDKEMKMNIRLASDSFNASMDSFSFRHGYDAVIRWSSDTKMRIEYPLDSELTHQEMVVFGTTQTFSPDQQIQLLYQEKPSTHGYFMLEKRCYNELK